MKQSPDRCPDHHMETVGKRKTEINTGYDMVRRHQTCSRTDNDTQSAEQRELEDDAQY